MKRRCNAVKEIGLYFSKMLPFTRLSLIMVNGVLYIDPSVDKECGSAAAGHIREKKSGGSNFCLTFCPISKRSNFIMRYHI
jgi:hypothetical protein